MCGLKMAGTVSNALSITRDEAERQKFIRTEHRRIAALEVPRIREKESVKLLLFRSNRTKIILNQKLQKWQIQKGGPTDVSQTM